MLKISLTTPLGIKYSYKGTTYHVYEYAKFIIENGLWAEVLVPKNKTELHKVKNYRQVSARYRTVPQKPIDVIKFPISLWRPLTYIGLPRDAVVYLCNSIYDSVINILFKPGGQKYIIAGHNMFLVRKSGGYEAIKTIRDALIKLILFIRRNELDNIYFHALNKEQAEYLRRVFNIKTKNIFYVPPMVESRDYRIKRNNSRRLRVLQIGGMGKGMQMVLDLIDRLNEMRLLSKFEFYFIGERNEAAEAKYKRMNRVRFLGEVSDREKSKVLSEMDAIMIPGSECFPKTVLEGLASGLYVLTSRRNGVWKDIRELGINATVIRNGLASEYMKPLMRLAMQKSHGGINLRYREVNRKVAVSEFDRSVVLPKALSMFSHVLHKE